MIVSPKTKMRFFSSVVVGFCDVTAASKEMASLSLDTDFGAGTSVACALLDANQAMESPREL